MSTLIFLVKADLVANSFATSLLYFNLYFVYFSTKISSKLTGRIELDFLKNIDEFLPFSLHRFQQRSMARFYFNNFSEKCFGLVK